MEDSSIAQLIGLMAGSIFFIDGWGPAEKGETDFTKSRRFRGLSVLIAGGIITPVLDYVSKNSRPEFFLAYLKGCIYGWFFVLLFGLFLYLFWIITKQNKKESILYRLGEFAYSVLDFIYLGISDNPHLTAKRNSDVALAQNIYKLESDYEYKRLEKALANADVRPNEIDDATKRKIQQYEEELKNIKTEANYTFNDWYYKGLAEFDKKEYEKVIAYMKNALEKDKSAPNAPDAYLYIGLSYEKLELFAKGIDPYETIIANYPHYEYMFLVYYDKAVLLRNLNRLKESLEINETAIKLNPGYAQAWYNKGYTLGKLNLDEEALKAYEEAIRVKPDYAEAWNNKGVRLRRLNRDLEALSAFEEAIRLKPDYTLAWVNKGVNLRRLKRNQEALDAYEQAIRLDSGNPDAWFNAASEYALKKEKDKMVVYLKKAIELDANNKEIAKTDEDFNEFRDDEAFKKLVGL